MTPHFSERELECKCGCGALPSIRFMSKVELVRVRHGKPMRVSSAKRCPDYNAKVSKTGRDGPHTKDAIDFTSSGADALDIVRIAIEEGFSGIGVSQKGPHGIRFIHIDDLPDALGQPRPTIWSY